MNILKLKERPQPKGMDATNYFWGMNYKPRAERVEDRAFITVFKDGEGRTRGILHDHIGPGFDYDSNADHECFVGELISIIEDAGTWIFEGELKSSRSHTPDGLEYDSWIEGEHRKLTPDEVELYEQTGCPWDPSEWGQPWGPEDKSMRQIFDHETPANVGQLYVHVQDDPGPGGANHHYTIEAVGNDAITNHEIHFQEGPIQENGVNGVTNEALIAVVIDRMRGFQSGPFNCRENDRALGHLEEALMWLKSRTNDRAFRGVEGKSEK